MIVRIKEKSFYSMLMMGACLLILLLVGFFVTLFWQAWLGMSLLKGTFFVQTIWDVSRDHYGIVTFVIGTLLTSFLALMIAVPFGLAISLLLTQYFTTGWVASFVRQSIDLLAGIPSVIFGFWGLLVLVPFIRSIQMYCGSVPYGVGIFTASLILALMVVPFIATIAIEVMTLVPNDLKEAAYALGATKSEVIRHVVLPCCASGIFSGVLLAFGRAIGETMAVTMVIGNANFFPKHLFDPGNTMASVIANEFAEATGELHVSALIYLALSLFVLSALINMCGKWGVRRWSLRKGH